MNWGWGGVGNGFFYNSQINYTQAVNSYGGSNVPNQPDFLDFQTVVYNIHL